MRVLFLGQKPIGQSCFDRLLEMAGAGKGLELAGAVSNTGTDTWWADNAIHRACREKGIPFIDNARRNEEEILAIAPHCDLLLSVQHGWILSERVLRATRHGGLNLHLAKLPEYGGWNAFTHAILNAETSYTVTLHWLSPDVDGGDIADTRSFPIGPDSTARSLWEQANRAAEEMFRGLCLTLARGELPGRRPQSGARRVYERHAIDAFRHIEDSNDATEMDRKARAFCFPPYEPASYTHPRGARIHVLPSADDVALYSDAGVALADVHVLEQSKARPGVLETSAR